MQLKLIVIQLLILVALSESVSTKFSELLNQLNFLQT